MPGSSSATAAHDFKKTFRDLIAVLFADDDNTSSVLVKFGRPSRFLVDDVVSFGRLSSEQDPATAGTNRSRDEVLQLDITISCFVAGDDDQEEVASDRAYDLLERIEFFARSTDPTIGNTVRECALVSHESDGMSPKTTVKTGRNIFLTATFEAKTRITGRTL
ncbi:MAG TPA: hypothetical protein VGM94_15125 [Galbitalea sp.]